MSIPAFEVIVCGSLHLDILLYAPRLPRPDETVAGERWAQACGGKGGNQAAMAARAGARTAMIGRVGDDDFGKSLRRHLIESGVDGRAVGVDQKAGSGISAAILQEDGEYGAVIVSGANLNIDASGLDGQWRGLGAARVLVLQNEVPEAVNIAAAKAAHASGAQVILNAAPARAMTPDLLEFVDILVVNRVEAAMLSGAEVESRASALAALPELGASSRAVIVTLGAEGLVAQAAGEAPFEIAAKPVKAVSTHGAGDCFVGALAARLAKGDTLREAAEFANSKAAEVVARAKS